jgi:hypothetical protein
MNWILGLGVQKVVVPTTDASGLPGEQRKLLDASDLLSAEYLKVTFGGSYIAHSQLSDEDPTPITFPPRDNCFWRVGRLPLRAQTSHSTTLMVQVRAVRLPLRAQTSPPANHKLHHTDGTGTGSQAPATRVRRLSERSAMRAKH